MTAQTMKDSRKLVQVRLTPRSLDNLHGLEKLTGLTNQTQLISASIDLAHEVLQTITTGGNVICENSDGTRDRLKPIGI